MGPEPKAPAPGAPKISLLPSPSDAAELAALDLKAALAARLVSPADVPYLWWIWDEDGTPESLQAISATLNDVSSASVALPVGPYVPGKPPPAATVVSRGKLVLVRVNLHQYAPAAEDLRRLLRVRDDLQFDPKFSRLITADTVKFLLATVSEPPKARVRRAVEKTRKVPAGRRVPRKLTERGVTWIRNEDDSDWERLDSEEGQRLAKGVQTFREETYTVTEDREIVVTEVKAGQVARLDSEAVNPTAYAELVKATGCVNPVVSSHYAIFRLNSTIKRKGVYSVIYGGRYFEAVGLVTADDLKLGGSDFDAALFQVGIGDGKAGAFKKLLAETPSVQDRVRKDKRVAMYRSGVTGRWRMIVFLDGRGGKTVFTVDFDAEDIDVGTNPFANLISTLKIAAIEAFFPQHNGGIVKAIYDGNGKLLEVAAQSVVNDRTVPAPHPPELQAPISCGRCHEAEITTDAGWKPVKNDVQQLVGGRIDIFGDLFRAGIISQEDVDRIAGLYSSEEINRKVLPRLRDDFSEFVLKSSYTEFLLKGVGKEKDDRIKNLVQPSARSLADIYNAYWYDPVGPAEALKELGIAVDEKNAVDVFNLLLIPPSPGELVDFRIAAQSRGIAIPRSDWDLVYSFAAARAQKSLAALRQQEQPGKKPPLIGPPERKKEVVEKP